MKLMIFKFFANYEKEEAWLNEMAADGLALTGAFLGFYRFEIGAPGEYIYRIEWLENRPEHPEGRKYIGFMTENNIEPVIFWGNRAYLRRKAVYGAFDLFSDVNSRLAHYQRQYAALNSVMILEFLVSIPWIAIFLLKFFDDPSVFNQQYLSFACLFLGLGLVFLLICRPIRKKIKALKREKLLRE